MNEIHNSIATFLNPFAKQVVGQEIEKKRVLNISVSYDKVNDTLNIQQSHIIADSTDVHVRLLRKMNKKEKKVSKLRPNYDPNRTQKYHNSGWILDKTRNGEIETTSRFNESTILLNRVTQFDYQTVEKFKINNFLEIIKAGYSYEAYSKLIDGNHYGYAKLLSSDKYVGIALITENEPSIPPRAKNADKLDFGVAIYKGDTCISNIARFYFSVLHVDNFGIEPSFKIATYHINV